MVFGGELEILQEKMEKISFVRVFCNYSGTFLFPLQLLRVLCKVLWIGQVTHIESDNLCISQRCTVCIFAQYFLLQMLFSVLLPHQWFELGWFIKCKIMVSHSEELISQEMHHSFSVISFLIGNLRILSFVFVPASHIWKRSFGKCLRSARSSWV